MNLGTLFNDYHRIFMESTDPTMEQVMIHLGHVIIYLYGVDEEKQKAYREKHPQFNQKIQWCTVSSNPVEIWGDLRQTKQLYNGVPKLVVNHIALGHELNHVLRIVKSYWSLKSEDPNTDNNLFLSPDLYASLL